MIQQMYSTYSIFFDEKLFSLPVIFIAVGVFIFVVAFFGCCGAIQESNYLLVTVGLLSKLYISCTFFTFQVNILIYFRYFQYAALLVFIFLMEAAGGIGGYVMKDDIHNTLSVKMNNSLKEYNTNVITTKTWNALQFDVSFFHM